MHAVMNSVWQHIMLATLPLEQWRGATVLYRRVVGGLQTWRRGSWLMQQADWIAAILLTIVFGLAPFVSTTLLGLLLTACAGLWLLMTLSDEEAGRDRPTHPLLTPVHLVVTVYWGISTLATVLSPVKRAALVGWSKLSLYILLFLLLARVLRSPRIRSWLITFYLHICLIVSVYGLRQWFFGAEALATWVDPTSPLSKTTRVYSYLGNPNLLAAYLVPAVVFSVAAWFSWRGWGPKALAAVMVAANASCLVFTYSRGGWIGMVVSLLVMGVLLVAWGSVHLPEPWRTLALPILLGGFIGVLVLAMLFVAPVRDRVASMFVGRGDSSNNFRINVWAAVIEMIQARPVLGIGPGNVAFNQVYPLYARPRFTALSAYSIFLEVLVESGFIGFACFLWFLAVTFNQGWTQLQQLRAADNRESFWLMAAIASMIGMLSHGLVDTVWYRPEISTLWWLSVAIIASHYTTIAAVKLDPASDAPQSA